jgi:hypothetical protein
MLAAVVAFALILTGIKHVLIDNRPRDVCFATLSGLFGHTTICARGSSGVRESPLYAFSASSNHLE